jgi:hypothetical protein
MSPEHQPLGQALSLVELDLERMRVLVPNVNRSGKPYHTVHHLRRAGDQFVPNVKRSGKPYHLRNQQRARFSGHVPNVKRSGKPCHLPTHCGLNP